MELVSELFDDVSADDSPLVMSYDVFISTSIYDVSPVLNVSF